MSNTKTRARTILIVGAGPGIGKATAERFGREGLSVVLASRNPKNLDPLLSAPVGQGVDAHAVVLDVTDADAVAVASHHKARFTQNVLPDGSEAAPTPASYLN